MNILERCDRCEGVGKAHGSDRPFEGGGNGEYPGLCPKCRGTGKTAKIVRFREWSCVVRRDQYGTNGRSALLLVDAVTGEHIATATANLVNEECGLNQAFIKDYSENSGILAALIAARIVKDTGVKRFSGYCTFPLVDIL